MDKQRERDAMAEFFYDEHRVERYSLSREHLPMWHELDVESQMRWLHLAGRLQQHLTMHRTLERRRKSA